jgi:hypothetical protein
MIIIEEILRHLSYDPETGIFTRLTANANRWKIGEKAGVVDDHGYIRIKISGRQYKAHRLAWFIMTGAFPTTQIDHENGHRQDNRWTNLRVATQGQNSQNCKIAKNNTSGIKGVRQMPSGKWQARITANGERLNLGRFHTKEEATAVVQAKRIELHQDFANHG